jgi:hypothetical protein
MYKKEAKEAAKAKTDSGSSFDDLSALIQRKNTQNFDNLISSLEAKYKGSDKGVKRKMSNR